MANPYHENAVSAMLKDLYTPRLKSFNVRPVASLIFCCEEDLL